MGRTKETFLEKAKKTHSDRYTYLGKPNNKLETRVDVVCGKHGVFSQMKTHHIIGHGCNKCANELRSMGRKNLDQQGFITEAKLVHKNKYDYSLVEYEHKNKKVKIICPVHGIFEQIPKSHLRGINCRKCYDEKAGINKRSTTAGFIKQANYIHSFKYDYSETAYVKSHEKVIIICKIHGRFKQKPYMHLNYGGCRKCSSTSSIQEDSFFNFLKTIYKGCIDRHNNIEKTNFELDIFIKDLNLAFEYNGIFWHSSFSKDKDYHINKTDMCEKKGIHLIHIYEDDWLFRRDIVESMVRDVFNVNKKINIKQCKIRLVNKKNRISFLNANHISSFLDVGLYYKNRLIFIMSFILRNGNWIIARWCNKINFCVEGGWAKIVNWFINYKKPKKITYFADRSWKEITGEIDKRFNLIGKTKPHVYYLIGNNRLNKQGFKKKSHKKIYKIYDCGNIKYVYNSVYGLA